MSLISKNDKVKYPQNVKGLIFISFIAFVALGLPDGLLGIAWPGIRQKFDLHIDALGIILICGTSGYMLSSFLSGFIMRNLGIGKILSISCSATATSLYIFSQTQSWLIFVIFAIVSGLGAGAIDAAINTYVAKYHSDSMMQWLHASFGVGITFGPIIMTIGISTTLRWEIGYTLVSVALWILTIFFFYTKDMWKDIKLSETKTDLGIKNTPLIETLKSIPVLLSMFIFFLYTGVELGLGHWTYSLLTESRQISSEISGIMASSYWAMFTLGRILAGWVAKKVDSKNLILFCVTIALFGIFLLIIDSGQLLTIIGISLTGFAVAPIFPGLVSNTAIRVGMRHHTNTIGLQMTAAGFGMAAVPSFAGVLAKKYSLEAIPIYLFIVLSLMLLVFLYLNSKLNK